MSKLEIVYPVIVLETEDLAMRVAWTRMRSYDFISRMRLSIRHLNIADQNLDANRRRPDISKS